MRIGLIRMRYTPFGGAEVFLTRFIEGLLRRGHGVEVFSAGWEGSSSVKVHKIEAKGPSFLRPLKFAARAKEAVEASRPDVVVSLERTYSQDIYRAGDGCHREWLIRKARASSPLRRVTLRLNPLHTVLLYLEKRLFGDSRLKMVVANSRMVKADIMRHYGLPEGKICVIYNGIDPGLRAAPGERKRLRESLGAKADTVVLLFVGSGFERKGLKYAIRALGLLKDRGDIRLVVAGKGNVSGYLREAERLGVDRRVVFMGPVNDVSGLYAASDVFVLPTLYEPFSNACLEALGAGLAVVTSRANGASEVLIEGVNGAIVEDPSDHAELARKIGLFLDATAREAARAEAVKTASMHSIDRTVEEFLRVIERVNGRA